MLSPCPVCFRDPTAQVMPNTETVLGTGGKGERLVPPYTSGTVSRSRSLYLSISITPYRVVPAVGPEVAE
jgi:hypothetical protein